MGEQILAGLGVAGALALISWVAPPVQTGLWRVFTCGATGRAWWDCQGSSVAIVVPLSLSISVGFLIQGYVEDAMRRRWEEDHPEHHYYSSDTHEYKDSPAARHLGIAQTWGALAAGAVILIATVAYGLIPADVYLQFLAW